ncbi:B-cell receptor CD22 isoform X2 [Anguilla rostrata]|uniref:B-cell receptor CD22 isoform X2 n=1 Tax=Anguilla rostrata TaxID=7938 RepID=UPI0030CA9E4A
MNGTVSFILIGCLLQGALGRDWAIWMPQSIEALSGSCVLIPCTFEIPSEYDQDLAANAKGRFMKGHAFGDRILLESSTARLVIKRSSIQGYLIGNLLEKNCTSILNNFTLRDSNKYLFRVESPNLLKFSFKEGVQINVTDSPPKPKLTPERVEVMEGASVSLSCSAAAPCPKLPPNLTWTPRLSDSVDQLQENEDRTKSVSSVLTFTASHLHHGQKITCRALYTLQQGDTQKTSEASLTLRVLYSPENTSVSVSPSGSVFAGSSVTLTCNSNANPPVQNYTWYKMKGRDIEVVGTGDKSVLLVSATDGGHYFCEARNPRGAQRSETVFLFFEGSKCSLAQHIICGTLVFLYILTVCVGVYKYKSLCKQIQAQPGEKGKDTYDRLQISTITSSDYDVIRKDMDASRGTDEGTCDYENIKRNKQKGAARNVQ